MSIPKEDFVQLICMMIEQLAYHNNKSTENFRFFNTQNGSCVYGMIGNNGAQVRKGLFKIMNDRMSGGQHSQLFLQSRWRANNLSLHGQSIKKGDWFNHFAIIGLDMQTHLNPATIMDCTSLWFRNNEYHTAKSGHFNQPGDIKRGMKALHLIHTETLFRLKDLFQIINSRMQD